MIDKSWHNQSINLNQVLNHMKLLRKDIAELLRIVGKDIDPLSPAGAAMDRLWQGLVVMPPIAEKVGPSLLHYTPDDIMLIQEADIMRTAHNNLNPSGMVSRRTLQMRCANLASFRKNTERFQAAIDRLIIKGRLKVAGEYPPIYIPETIKIAAGESY